MPRLIRSVLNVILRVFFPRIEISGIDRVPANGPVMLVVNHPNGLIDPLFLLCLSPRPVSFLAKAPLFEMPVISWFVKAMGSIPVYRRQDGAFEPAKNRQTFERARTILSSGGAIAIFPEGASHGDPKLRPIKTGAARIALGATATNSDAEPLAIVPLGIYYTAKRTFRSSALLYFGEPFSVAPAPLKSNGEPEADAVRAVTGRIEQALNDVTLQADEHEALALVGRAEEVFSSEDPRQPNGSWTSSSCAAASWRATRRFARKHPGVSRRSRRVSLSTKQSSARPGSTRRHSSPPRSVARTTSAKPSRRSASSSSAFHSR